VLLKSIVEQGLWEGEGKMNETAMAVITARMNNPCSTLQNIANEARVS